MSYAIPHPTFAVTRQPVRLDAGTLPPEHILTGGAILATCALHERGCEVYDTTVGELQRLAIGQGLDFDSADYCYRVEREA